MTERTPDVIPPEGGASPTAGVSPERTAGVPPERPRDERQRDLVPEPEIMPRWVPILIGGVLVTLGGLAVYTGFRFQKDDFPRFARRTPSAPRETAPRAPSGELDAGGSLVNPGQAAPAADEPVSGASRAIVSGGPGGVDAVVRMRARRGLRVNATPPDALVYVNQMLAGHASQFDTADEIYEFAEPGSYTIRVTAPGYRERQYVVTVDEAAEGDVATIDARLDQQ